MTRHTAFSSRFFEEGSITVWAATVPSRTADSHLVCVRRGTPGRAYVLLGASDGVTVKHSAALRIPQKFFSHA
jgi:hypothetical protein